MSGAASRQQHPIAPLAPRGPRRMVTGVLDQKWTIEATAQRFQIDAKTVRMWRDRFLADGNKGFANRSACWDQAGIGSSDSADIRRRRPKTRYAKAPGGIPATRRHMATGPRTASGGRRRRSRCARKISRAATIHPIAIWIGGGRRSASLEGLTTSGPQLTRRHDRRSRSMRALRRRRRPLQSRPLRSRHLRQRGPAPAPGGPSSS